MNSFLTFHVEATPDSVNIMYRSSDGMTERVEAISYIDAVNRLGAGNYDDRPDEGTSIYLAIADGGNQGHFDHTSQYNVIMWRWLIATMSVLEIREGNGTVNIIDDTGNPPEVVVYSNGIVTMSLCPVTERLAITDNIEGTMTGRFGIGSGTERAIIFHGAMMDVEQGALTPSGRETLAEFHDSFVAELSENGTPAEPVTH